MALTVQVPHPAYVSHRPRRARGFRRTLVSATAPATLRETDAAGFERPFVMHKADVRRFDVEPWVRDGVTWRPLRHFGYGENGGGLGAITVNEFGSWLRGEVPEEGSLWRGLAHAFEATPLMLRMPGLGLGERSDARLRGVEAAEDGLGEISEDERPGSAGAVARFVSEELLVADGTLLMRWRPLVRISPPAERPTGPDDFLIPHLGREVSLRRPGFDPGREPDAQEWYGSHIVGPSAVAARLRELPGCGEGHDLSLMANALPAAVLAGLAVLGPGRDAERRAALSARIEGYARLGERGLVAGQDVADCYEAMSEAVEDAGNVDLSHYGASRTVWENYANAARYVVKIAMPRVRDAAAAVDAADAGALGALAP